MFQLTASVIQKFFGRTRRAPRDRLRSAEELARILEVERQRADRGKTGFALVTFSPSDDRLRGAVFDCLALILQTRLRITDEAGWLDGQRVAAVLPLTDAEGAWTVANSVCESFPENLPRPLCGVLTYPTADSESDQPCGATAGPAEADLERRETMEVLFAAQMPAWKRSLDVVGASLGLVVLSPVFLAVAVAIKCTSRGPVLFKQLRSGLGGRSFWIYKFRTMVVDAEARKKDIIALNEQDGPAFKVKNDPRVTQLGRILRSTSIDELPQLWNVLRGDMSLVGPRPLPSAEAEGCDPWHRRRLAVTPGLTCIWQVQGRSRVTFDEWARMDIEYIQSRTLRKDLKLILQTIPAVFKRNGAH